MSKNKNKLEQMEEEIWSNQSTKNRLYKTMDPLILWLEEMWKSFANIFAQWKWNNMINLDMDRFENKVLKNLKI